jgi:hypothetical protein
MRWWCTIEPLTAAFVDVFCIVLIFVALDPRIIADAVLLRFTSSFKLLLLRNAEVLVDEEILAEGTVTVIAPPPALIDPTDLRA